MFKINNIAVQQKVEQVVKLFLQNFQLQKNSNLLRLIRVVYLFKNCVQALNQEWNIINCQKKTEVREMI